MVKTLLVIGLIICIVYAIKKVMKLRSSYTAYINELHLLRDGKGRLDYTLRAEKTLHSHTNVLVAICIAIGFLIFFLITA